MCDHLGEKISTRLLLSLTVVLSSSLINLLIFTTAVASTDEKEDEEILSRPVQDQKFETYQNDDYGFSIEYPADWEISDYRISEEVKDLHQNEPWNMSDDVCFRAPDIKIEERLNGTPYSPAHLCIMIFEIKAEKYLDPNEMTIKTKAVPNMTAQQIALGDLMHGFFFLEETRGELVRNNETTFGLGNYPGWRIDATYSYTSESGTDAGYDIGIYSVTEGKISIVRSASVDLVALEYLPILQRMISSFHITG